ncbi:hypothetical protein SAMN00017477_0112 [Peptoniphilus asaccharolyticus DSM 20463]|uniref:Uncharacterized protein n=1 Tax=Peptoniphilus asaccharolyticus DSM 20463 TaxID=573058 RepID=A0A1W1UCW6_PEPAS|nr:hypothetical protein [Peptoniphilus asaccharolyticus]MBL7576451.1 hypothetical protein [Peptoniphilus asaccharolyticus]SMB78873.1 hypothetical protein SAMN00017477_0112 [Peptoniphilus asaccharolyticus DSM 20463]
MKKKISLFLLINIIILNIITPIYASSLNDDKNMLMHDNFQLIKETPTKIIYSYDNNYTNTKDRVEVDYIENTAKIYHGLDSIDVITYEKNGDSSTNILLNGKVVGKVENENEISYKSLGEWTYKNTSMQLEAVKSGALGAVLASLFGPIGWGTILNAIMGFAAGMVANGTSPLTNLYYTLGAKRTIDKVEGNFITYFEERKEYTYKDPARTVQIDYNYDSFYNTVNYYH